MYILALNCGSATVKIKLFFADKNTIKCIHSDTEGVAGSYHATIRKMLEGLYHRPDTVVHRVVHGGRRFREPVLLDDEVIQEIEELSELAPLHNPPALKGMKTLQSLQVPMFAVFDTAFHQSIPDYACFYALPETLREKFGIQRYGFHGISHQYVTERFTELTGNKKPCIISVHLGNGCSITAVKDGCSIDTSMGFSPLDGLIMGTRSGDLDPAIILFLIRKGFSADGIERLLNHESGLRGIAGTNDMRELLKSNDVKAHLAIDMFCYRIQKYIGAYLAVLEKPESIVFTGGIGENSPEIRKRICNRFEWTGLILDDERNMNLQEGKISKDNALLKTYVIKTDEELLMARTAFRILHPSKK